MAKKKHNQLFKLNEAYFSVHKTQIAETGFGLDHTPRLIEEGFGIYSSVNLKDEIGPLKSNFYRVALCLEGGLQVDIGVETYRHKKNTIHFNVPDRLFMMKNVSPDLKAYYLFFSADFIEEVIPEGILAKRFPFLHYLNTPFFELMEEEAENITQLMYSISNEIAQGLAEFKTSIKLLILMIFIAAKRSYNRQQIDKYLINKQESHLVSRFKKMVAQNFITLRNVKDYANKMAVSTNHLSKIIKHETGKTAGEFIDEMLIMEIKALLRYSELNVSEITHQLDFTDTSHLSKFFKKYTELSPLGYRKKFQ